MSKDDQNIGGLIALGFIILIGYCIYKILKPIAPYKEGDKVSSNELDSLLASSGQNIQKGAYAYCEICGEVTERFERKYCFSQHCKKCHKKEFWGEASCYCGNCMFCYGCAGGNECNTCSSDD